MIMRTMGLKIEGALIAMRWVDTACRPFVENVFYVWWCPVPYNPMLSFTVSNRVEYCAEQAPFLTDTGRSNNFSGRIKKIISYGGVYVFEIFFSPAS